MITNIFFWINMVLCVILIFLGLNLISRKKNSSSQSKAVGGTICVFLGIIGIITRIIQLTF